MKHRSWRASFGVLAVFGPLALAACTKSEPPSVPSADRERLEKLAEEMRTAARAANAKRTNALLVAADTLGPREDLGSCPIKVPIVGTEDRTRIGEGEPKDAPVDWRSIRAQQMMVVDRPELPLAKSARLDHILEMVDFQLSRLNATNVADTESWIRRFGDPKTTPWEMVIVASRRIAPKLVERGKFDGGVILGRAFVYDHLSGEVVCAANVLSESSKLLTGGGASTGLTEIKLKMDLENEAFRDAANHLVKAGPRLAPREDADAGTKADAGAR